MFRSRRLKTNLRYNAGNTKDRENFDAVAAANYVAPLPLATSTTSTTSTTVGTVGVGSSGNWQFTEIQEMDGVSLLNLIYKNQQIHTFLSNDPTAA